MKKAILMLLIDEASKKRTALKSAVLFLMQTTNGIFPDAKHFQRTLHKQAVGISIPHEELLKISTPCPADIRFMVPVPKGQGRMKGQAGRQPAPILPRRVIC